VNLGNPDEITIRACGEEILRLTGAKQQLVSRPLPQDDPKQRRPDISLAKKLLGLEPKVDLRSQFLPTTGIASTRFSLRDPLRWRPTQ
jgi:dTDP-glucose 4,6-dehydratase